MKFAAAAAATGGVVLSAGISSANGHCTITPKIISASGLSDSDFLSGTSDPYVSVHYGLGNVCTSSVVLESTDAEFNHACPERAYFDGLQVKATVWDKDLGADDILGTGIIKPTCPTDDSTTCATETISLDNGGSVTIEYCMTNVALDETCTTSTTYEDSTCDWYENCLNKAVPCLGDSAEYAIEYGKRKCFDFDLVTSEFSANGLEWVKNTRACLQRELIPKLDHPIPCSAMRTEAFEAHVGCYLGDNGAYDSVCTILANDAGALIKAIEFDLFTGETVKQALPVIQSCLTDGIISGFKMVGDFAGVQSLVARQVQRSRSIASETVESCVACGVSEDARTQILEKLGSLGVTDSVTLELAKMERLEGDEEGKIEFAFILSSSGSNSNELVQQLIELIESGELGFTFSTVDAVGSVDIDEILEFQIQSEFVTSTAETVAEGGNDDDDESSGTTGNSGLAGAIGAAAVGAAVVAAVALVVVRRRRNSSSNNNSSSSEKGLESSSNEMNKVAANPLFNPEEI